MLSILLMISLSTVPRVHPSAEVAVYVPSLRQLEQVTPFLRQAGMYAVALRTEGFRDTMHPVLNVDLTRLDEVEAAGIDPARGVTVSFPPNARVSCVALRHPKRYQAAVEGRLKTVGQLWRGREAGARLLAATLDGKWLQGSVLRPNEACTVRFSRPSGEALLREVARMLARPASARAFERTKTPNAVAFVKGPFGNWAIEGAPGALTASTGEVRPSIVALNGPGKSPYALWAPDGLLRVRARLKKEPLLKQLPLVLRELGAVCPGLSEKAVGELGQSVSRHLTGNVALWVSRVQVETALRTPSGRFFAAKLLFLAELSSPPEASSALSALAQFPQARAVADNRYEVTCEKGTLWVGIFGPHLFVANEGKTLEEGLASLPARPDTQKHSLEFAGHLPLWARGLSQIPLFEALGQPELAGLFAVGTELGPLMSKSETLSGHLQALPSGRQAASVRWQLATPKTP